MKKVSFLHSIYIRFLFQLIVLAVVPLTFLIIILTNLGTQNNDESRYRFNTSVNSSIVQNITNSKEFTARTTQSLLANQNLVSFLNADYSTSEDYATYISSIQSYVQAIINANPRTELYVYTANDTIPMSMDVFFHLADIKDTAPIADFLSSDEIDCWLCGEDFADIQNSFLFSADNHFVYLRKAYDSTKNFLGLIVYSMPENYVLAYDGDVLGTVLASGHSRIINFADTAVEEDVLDTLLHMTDSHLELNGMLITKETMEDFPFDFYVITTGSNYERLLFLFVAMLGIFSVLSIIICTRNLRKLVLQMNHCLSAMDTSISNNYKTRVPVSGSDEMALIERRINLLLDQANELLQQNIRKETSNKESKLIALQHQINPHFIYNTMEVFSSKMKLYGYYDESDAMVAFANLFRYNVATNDALVTLREELRQTKNYINIQRLRYPKLVLEDTIADEFLDTAIPKFTLQPIIENAIQHGIADTGDTFVIILSARRFGSQLIFSAGNNGLCIPADQCECINQELLSTDNDETLATGGYSIGLRNINSRLRLYFGSQYHLTLSSDNNQTTVEFLLPMRSLPSL